MSMLKRWLRRWGILKHSRLTLLEDSMWQCVRYINSTHCPLVYIDYGCFKCPLRTKNLNQINQQLEALNEQAKHTQ